MHTQGADQVLLPSSGHLRERVPTLHTFTCYNNVSALHLISALGSRLCETPRNRLTALKSRYVLACCLHDCCICKIHIRSRSFIHSTASGRVRLRVSRSLSCPVRYFERVRRGQIRSCCHQRAICAKGSQRCILHMLSNFAALHLISVLDYRLCETPRNCLTALKSKCVFASSAHECCIIQAPSKTRSSIDSIKALPSAQSGAARLIRASAAPCVDFECVRRWHYQVFVATRRAIRSIRAPTFHWKDAESCRGPAFDFRLEFQTV